MTSRPRKQTRIDPSPQAARVRENQRRSRARKREYLTSLEEKLRKCREEGAKASVDVQVAARWVVEENRGLRLILNDLGLENDEIQQRIRKMRERIDENPDETSAWVCEKCRREVVPVARACGVAGRTPQTAVATSPTLTPTPPTTTTTTVPGDIYKNIALLDTNICAQLLEDGSMVSTTSNSNIGPTFVENSTIISSGTSDQQSPLNTEHNGSDIDLSQFLVDTTVEGVITESTTAADFPEFDFLNSIEPSIDERVLVPLDCSGNMSESLLCPTVDNSCTADRASSTPCTVAYRLLKALNARRKKEKDLFDIVLELWNGFRLAPEGDTEGCRIDDKVFFKVAGELLEPEQVRPADYLETPAT